MGYASKFQGDTAVARYRRKFANRVDRIRHDAELAFLGRHASGRLYDCTIGIGRFIGSLPKVTSYSGADLSQEFVDYIAHSFPGVAVRRADLIQGITEPDKSVDTAICLRSLSAIGRLETILPEMVRIVKPGGIVVVDYGRRPSVAELDGASIVLDGENFEEVIQSLDVDVIERLQCDALTTRIKLHPRVFRLVTGQIGRLVPDVMLRLADEAAARFVWQRQIVALRRRG